MGRQNKQGMSVPCSSLHYDLSDQHTVQLTSQQYQQKHDIIKSEKVPPQPWHQLVIDCSVFQVTYWFHVISGCVFTLSFCYSVLYFCFFLFKFVSIAQTTAVDHSQSPLGFVDRTLEKKVCVINWRVRVCGMRLFVYKGWSHFSLFFFFIYSYWSPNFIEF